MHLRKELRKKEADERAAERSKRSPQEQLQVLDAKLGVGVGARRERAKLQRLVGVASNG